MARIRYIRKKKAWGHYDSPQAMWDDLINNPTDSIKRVERRRKVIRIKRNVSYFVLGAVATLLAYFIL